MWPKQKLQVSHQKNPILTQVNQPLSPIEPKIDKTVPLQSVESCLPDGFLQVDLLADYVWNDQKLYYLSIIFGASDAGQSSLISVTQKGCKVLNPSADGSPLFLSEVLPKDVALKLSISKYQKIFENVGGKDKFQEILNQDAEGGGMIMSQENFDALKQLGIKIPASVKPVKNFPKGSEI